MDETTPKQNWCPWRESDPRPLPYQGSALPLSHKGQNARPSAKRLENLTNNHSATGAGDGNRTRVISLEGWGSTIELLPPKPRWPSNTKQNATFTLSSTRRCGRSKRSPLAGGGDWIRTSVGVSQQIYSLPPLATRAPLHSRARDYAMKIRPLRSGSVRSTKNQPLHHATALRPCLSNHSLASPKCPHPQNGVGGRRADKGEGWLAMNTACRAVSTPTALR